MVTVAFGWAAYATRQLDAYAPLSWLTISLFAALLFSFLYWLVCKGYSARVSANIKRTFYDVHPTIINPLQNVFQRQRIDIKELVVPFDREVKNKDFIECDIIGPANISFSGTTVGRTNVLGNTFINCIGVITKNNVFVPELIRFVDCRILRGRLYGFLLMIPESSYQFAKENMPDLPIITLEPITQSTVTHPIPTPVRHASIEVD